MSPVQARRRQAARTPGRGFTLIELLVVIAIIALLMSILMPALGNVRRMAKEAICGTNVRHLVTSFHLYAEDHDERLPDMSRNRDGGRGENQVAYWITAYYRDLLRSNYNMQREMLYSPSNPYWNRDDFYYYGGSSCVIGYFAWGGDDRLQHEIKEWMPNPPDTATPLFATHLYDDTYYDFLWTDLNRQWPAGSGWITPNDPRRWGSNHLYDRLWPTGSHVGHITGGVSWTDGEDLERRFTRNAEFWW